ncbi:MAG: glycosyltransferase family 2 protein [Desulfovibrio sp.]|nr:glycosyltransferase family 2 protein [Desulfovibrio sp.]
MKPVLESRDVTVLIVNYRGADDTINCLRSLHDLVEPPGRIIVIDNDSNDGSVDKIFFAWREFASPTIVKGKDIETTDMKSRSIILMMPQNGGYAYGNNAGMRLAFRDSGCKAIWILNNDTIVHQYALKELCNRYNKHIKPCIIGSTLIYADDETKIQATAGSKLFLPLGLTAQLYNNADINKLDDISQDDVEKKLSDIIGASFFIHRDVVKKNYFFKEDFFLYLEETEYCIRATKNGINLLWAKHSLVIHKEGGSINANNNTNRPVLSDFLMLRNRSCLVKNYLQIMLPILFMSYIIVSVKRIFRKQLSRIPLVFIAFFDGISGRMGKPNNILIQKIIKHENR